MENPTKIDLNKYLDLLDKEICRLLEEIERHQIHIDKENGYIRMKLENKKNRLEDKLKFAEMLKGKFLELYGDQL